MRTRKPYTIRLATPGNHDWLLIRHDVRPGVYAGARRHGSRSWGVYFRKDAAYSTMPVPAFGQRLGQEEELRSRNTAIKFALDCLVAGRIVP